MAALLCCRWPPEARVWSLERTASSKGGGGVEQVEGRVPPTKRPLQLALTDIARRICSSARELDGRNEG